MSFDSAPLLELARHQLRITSWTEASIDDSRSTTANPRLAELCGVNERTIQRWRMGGRVSEEAADRVAVTLGTHPGLVWPEWWNVEEGADA